ncbi:MAG: hypothetical protein M1833_004267 [Piccolia ochrophora]|nr:MAG: hypothetical protein M1833_004267 [Piccolia ochrophora]
MENVNVYAAVSAALIASWIALRAMKYLIYLIRLSLTFATLKYLIYPQLYRRRRFCGTVTPFELLAVIAYLVANVICILVGTPSQPQISARAGVLSVINIIPLLMGGNLSRIADWMGVTLRTHAGVHRWVGRTAFAHTLLHTIITVRRSFSLKNPVHLSGVTASTAIGLLCVLSLPIIRYHFYEFFLKLHSLLVVVLLIALWNHVPRKKLADHLYLIIGISFLGGTFLYHLLRLAFRNIKHGVPCPRAEIAPMKDAIKVTVSLARPWEFRAGQYVYLWIPGMSFWAFLQSHPFMVTWWEEQGSTTAVSLLVQPLSGFTSNLLKSSDNIFRAAVDGPYGLHHDFGEYGSVFLFATGIGVASHIPYIRELIKGYNDCKVRTRRVSLIWQLEKECHQEWVQDWMDKLLQDDSGYVSLYVLDKFNHSDSKYGDREVYGQHNRIKKFFGLPDIHKLLTDEMENRKGKTLVSGMRTLTKKRNYDN